MTAFKDQIRRHLSHVKTRERKLYKACVEHAYRSIRFGSDVTGAPGQPVDTGALIASWKLEIRAKRVAAMFSPLFYAPIIEDNFRGAVLRSATGGFHSVKMTRINWQKIVNYELGRLDMLPEGDDIPSGLPIVTPGWSRDAKGRFSAHHSAQLGIGVPRAR